MRGRATPEHTHTSSVRELCIKVGHFNVEHIRLETDMISAF